MIRLKHLLGSTLRSPGEILSSKSKAAAKSAVKAAAGSESTRANRDRARRKGKRRPRRKPQRSAAVAAPSQPSTSVPIQARRLVETALAVPARAAALTRVERRAIDGMFSSIPRPELAEVLRRADLSDKPMLRFAMLLDDGEHKEEDWDVLCRTAGVAPRTVLQTIVDTYIMEGNLRAARLMPELIESLAATGMERVTECYVCADETGRGTGVVTVEVEEEGTGSDGNIEMRMVTKQVACGNCVRGRVLVPADLIAAKMAMESVGAIGNRGPATAMQFNFGNGRGGNGGGGQFGEAPDMSDFSRESDDVFEFRNIARERSAATGAGATATDFKEAETV